MLSAPLPVKTDSPRKWKWLWQPHRSAACFPYLGPSGSDIHRSWEHMPVIPSGLLPSGGSNISTWLVSQLVDRLCGHSPGKSQLPCGSGFNREPGQGWRPARGWRPSQHRHSEGCAGPTCWVRALSGGFIIHRKIGMLAFFSLTERQGFFPEKIPAFLFPPNPEMLVFCLLHKPLWGLYFMHFLNEVNILHIFLFLLVLQSLSGREEHVSNTIHIAWWGCPKGILMLFSSGSQASDSGLWKHSISHTTHIIKKRKGKKWHRKWWLLWCDGDCIHHPTRWHTGMRW